MNDISLFIYIYIFELLITMSNFNLYKNLNSIIEGIIKII